MQPRLYDTFYLSSAEAFSKKGAEITIRFRMDGSANAAAPDGVKISWEYWNGSIWQVLKMDENSVDDFNLKSLVGDIKFMRPDDLRLLR